MPAMYEKMRDEHARKGKPYDKAQAIAAATFHKMTGKTVQEAMGKHMKKRHEEMHGKGK